MKFEILQEEFFKGLSFVGRAIASRVQLPILSTILIQAKKDGIYLAATDLELSLRTKIFGKVTEEGIVAVPARTLLDLVGASAQGKMWVALNKETLVLTAPGYSGKIQTVAAEEFPQLPVIPVEGGYTLSVADLVAASDKTVYASAKDLLRPVLTGVYLERVAGGLKLVATDGFRLAVVKVKGKLEEKGGNYLVPARVIAEAARVEAEEIRIVPISENQVGFVGGETMIATQTIDGTFPDYDKIVPAEFVTSVEVSREELLSAVKTVHIFARDNSNMVKWNVTAEGITLSAAAPERGEATAEVVASVDGDGGEIVFNAKFVIDFLQNSSAETVLFQMNDNLKPGAFAEKGNENYLYIVMPINA